MYKSKLISDFQWFKVIMQIKMCYTCRDQILNVLLFLESNPSDMVSYKTT